MTTVYEILAIVDNSLDEKSALSQAKESIGKRISDLGGKLTFEDFWGARGFAYRIKKQTWGYYFCAQFELDSSVIQEFKKDLSIDGKIVRFLISKVDKNAPAPKTYTEMEKEWATTDKEKKLSEMDKKTKKTLPPSLPVKKESKEKKEKVSTTKESKPKVKKDVVDKKLDEILEDSSLDL
jgi:ribosomal protein S6